MKKHALLPFLSLFVIMIGCTTHKQLFTQSSSIKAQMTKDSAKLTLIGRADISGQGFQFKNADSIIVYKNKRMIEVYNAKEVKSNKKIHILKQSNGLPYFIYKP